LIINKFYDRFNSKKSDGKGGYVNAFKNQLTYEYLASELKIQYNKNSMECTIKNAVENFFNKYNWAGLCVYNCYMQLLYRKSPDEKCKSPLVLKIMIKDEHVYQLNENLRSLDQLINYEDDERNTLKPSNKFYIKDEKQEVIIKKEVYLKETDDLFSCIKDELKSNNKLDKLIIVSEQNLTELFFENIKCWIYTKNKF